MTTKLIELVYLFSAIFIHCFPLPKCNANYTHTSMLCPSGYWSAIVDIGGGPYGTDRTFALPYMPEAEEPICQFCPMVGCYVVRRQKETTPEESGQWRVTTTLPTITTTERSDTIGTEQGTEETGTSDQVTNFSSHNDTPTEPKPQYVLHMSCDYWTHLPPPADIVSYLDCVMIGEKNNYYIYIYEPRFREFRVPVVDCVDANFLAWIPDGTQLLGLELGFRMRAIPPFLFRYYQRIMQLTQYICIDGSSLDNKSIPFEDTERFASNKLTQVVFRSDSLKRDRRPPKAPDGQYTTEFQSEELIAACPHIVQHKPANITPNSDCQFSPGALPTTSDRVDQHKALQRCPFRLQLDVGKKEPRRRKPHTGLVEELKVPPAFLSACLLVLVLLLTVGIIIAFCVVNAEKLMLCRTRSRKRREREAALAQEMAEQAAKEAAAAAAAAAEAEVRQQNAWHPIYGRYGMVPPTMGGAFGVFAARPMDMTSNQQPMMGMAGTMGRPAGAGGTYFGPQGGTTVTH
ncbi:uncharacterized protein DEA37_0002628 [Paragonimus westermani]|uniref:Uncharacterized protein n=1 Tax=Paragonimus westermani TaxID=34504 RepID=A0A5J4NDY7_9TREM|nr:uncharacterized protein DEA37_0002628 [Paragonimus westermani]